MLQILTGILTLIQYKIEIENNPLPVRPDRCECCGKLNPWRHGTYPRKSARPDASLNPILIQRYYCAACRRTTLAQPECISPRRWYLWEIQQAVLTFFMLGESTCAIAKKTMPSRHTIARWINRFVEQFRLYKDVLCNQIIELGRFISLADFWCACFKKMTLGAAMRLCHVAGVPIP